MIFFNLAVVLKRLCVCACVRACVDQESFINISVPKIDKDYSLYRTYVIFRTLGLRHLVVVDVHNHVVGLITRKDLLPFKMQERLESLLEQTTTLSPELEFAAATGHVINKSVDSGKGSSCSEKQRRRTRTPDAISNQSADFTLPAITRSSSAAKMSLNGLDDDDEVHSITSAAADIDKDDLGDGSGTLSQIVVTISPPDDDDDDDIQSTASSTAAESADGDDLGHGSDPDLTQIMVTVSPPLPPADVVTHNGQSQP